MSTERQDHWQGVYASRSHTDVSWYQVEPARSLEFIEASGVARDRAIVDVGGGASTLVDHLLDRGYTRLTVLDIAADALRQSQERLGQGATAIDWRVADVVSFRAERRFALWHDRAVLHFLVDAAERKRYVEGLRRALAPGGHVVLAAFGPDGPQKCSGLPVRRYSVEMFAALLGPEFELLDQAIEEHTTPGGATQQFLYTRWQRAFRLETPRLVLRRVTLDDADLMLAVWNDPGFIRNVGDRGIRTIEQARAAMRAGALQLYADYGYGPYAVTTKADGERIGICGLFRRDNLEHPDIGFAILPDYRGRGLAEEAAVAVRDHAIDDLALETLTAIVSPDNAPSIALIEKLGLTFDRMITMPGDDEAIRLYRMHTGEE
jgi:RimJ/RimL family protein N-acetyltransferase